jgi:hypothetical protein
MITNDLDYFQGGSNSAVLGIIDPNAGAPVAIAQATATTDRAVMLRSLFLLATTVGPPPIAVGGSITALNVQSFNLNYSAPGGVGGNGFPLTAFGFNSGLHRFLDVLCGLWVSQQVTINATLDVAAVIRGSIGVDDLEGTGSARAWRLLIDSLRRSNVPPGRIDMVLGCGVQNAQVGNTVFTGTCARPVMGPGMLVCDTSTAGLNPGELVITDISINNVSQLPSLAQTIPFEAFQPQNFQRAGFVIAKPLDLGTPVSVTISNTTAAPIANIHVGFVNPPAFAIAEMSRSYSVLPASERNALEKVGASPMQLLGAQALPSGRIIGR